MIIFIYYWRYSGYTCLLHTYCIRFIRNSHIKTHDRYSKNQRKIGNLTITKLQIKHKTLEFRRNLFSRVYCKNRQVAVKIQIIFIV